MMDISSSLQEKIRDVSTRYVEMTQSEWDDWMNRLSSKEFLEYMTLLESEIDKILSEF